MRFHPRLSALILCAVFGFSLGLAPAPAHAAKGDMMRMSQMRLADLGYYKGAYDGTMGRKTKTALKKFQRNNGLPVTGLLTAQTFDLLLAMDYRLHHGHSLSMNHTGTLNHTGVSAHGWQYAGSGRIPTRFGAWDINEDDRGGLKRYTIAYHGKPILRVGDQTGPLQFSKPFSLKGEDAVIITAYHGAVDCAYRNYLLTMHSNGTVDEPRAIGSCASASQARIANNALFVSFPATVNPQGYAAWDVWRYENAELVQL